MSNMKLLLLAFFISLSSCFFPTHEELGHNPPGTQYVVFWTDIHIDTVKYDVWTYLTTYEGSNYILNKESSNSDLIKTTAKIKKLESK